MDPQLKAVVQDEANRQGLALSESFVVKLDDYLNKYFRGEHPRNKLIIQTYLARAGLRIAKADGKKAAEAEDAKAAIWFFHLPEGPDDRCIEAGLRILEEERGRSGSGRRLLTESFAKLLDATNQSDQTQYM